MRDPFAFHRVDILRAALQVQGATQLDIAEVLSALKKAAKTPAHFDEWNRLLTEKEVGVITLMLKPGGNAFASEVLETLRDAFMLKTGVTIEEIQQWLKPRIEGLN